jgi:hypothetical protein
MRIVLVNWARIWDGAEHGGGVNQYCQALALDLIRRGHEVVSLFGGITYVPDRKDCFIRRHDDWMGVKVFEVINSPVMAPAAVQFREPMGEVSAPELEARVGELFEWLKPDAVHFNNLEGFSIGCVERAKRVGAKTIFSLHNYHTLCPQVYFMQGHRETCYDFDNGHNCAKCVDALHPGEERAKLEAEFARGRGGKEVQEAAKQFREAAGGPWRALKSGVGLARAWWRTRGRLPGSAVSGAGDVTSARPAGEGDARGRTPQLMAELNPPKSRDADAPELRPLDNSILPEPPSAKPPNDYARRRAAMVQMLSSCDRVLAVSTFVGRKFASMGVSSGEGGSLRVLPIGSRINRVIALKPDLLFDPPPFEPAPMKTRPVRLLFLGYNHHYKGLPMVAETLEMMSPEHLRRIDLSVFALGGQTIEWMFRRLEPRLGKLKYAYGYTFHDIPWMMGGKDLTLVPSVWWDNAPQTVFESMSCGVPVLGAAVGGIPDFVHHGVNGLLFRGNDREDLKRRLIEVIENPWQLEELRKNVRPCKSIEEHTPEMERIYRGEDVGEMVMSEERVQVVVSAAAGAGSQGAAVGGER